MAVIIESVSGTGKTIAGLRRDCLDMDAEHYQFFWDEHYALPPKERQKQEKDQQVKNPDWQKRYLDEIVKQSSEYKVIFVAFSFPHPDQTKTIDPEVLKKWLAENGLQYIQVIPENGDEREFLALRYLVL